MHTTFLPSWPRQVPNGGVIHKPSSTSEASTVHHSRLVSSFSCPTRVADRPRPGVLFLIHLHSAPAIWPATTFPQRNRQARLDMEVKLRAGWSFPGSVADTST